MREPTTFSPEKEIGTGQLSSHDDNTVTPLVFWQMVVATGLMPENLLGLSFSHRCFHINACRINRA